MTPTEVMLDQASLAKALGVQVHVFSLGPSIEIVSRKTSSFFQGEEAEEFLNEATRVKALAPELDRATILLALAYPYI